VDETLSTDVLVIGSGPAGGAALTLATPGVDHTVIIKYRVTANTPRAHITDQRTMVIFRDLGIEDDVLARSKPATYVIGPGREYTDLYDDWARACEVGEDGCALARPDAHVAWRAAALASDPTTDLHRVLPVVPARNRKGASNRGAA
jgi:2-polyprenyl-6-methoxyphenol hydroxylase-like FAD-dependent oxidoreductase